MIWLIATLVGIYAGGAVGTLISAYMLWRRTSGAPLGWTDLVIGLVVLTGWPFVAVALWISPDDDTQIVIHAMAARIVELERQLADRLDS